MRSRTSLFATTSALALILAATPVLAVDQPTLDAANDYTDDRIGEAMDYADSVAGDAYSRASDYTDQQTADTYTRATRYTDSSLVNYATLERMDRVFADSLSQSKSYTDQRYSQGLTGYATTQALNDSFASAIRSANSYTDQRTWDTLMQSQSYTDAQIARLDRILSSGIAAVAAQPDLPSLQKGQFGIAVGSGHYNGYNALGARIGFSPIENMLFGVGVSGALDAEESETVVRTSASFVW